MESINFTGQVNDSIELFGDGTASQIIATGRVSIQGPPGINGHGVPAGGAEGQVLRKLTNGDFESEWIAPEALPIGTATQASLDMLTAAMVNRTDDQDVDGAKNFLDILTQTRSVSSPGIPIVPRDGLYQIRDQDGLLHFAIWPTRDNGTAYQFDIWGRDNLYIGATNSVHTRFGFVSDDPEGDPKGDFTTGSYNGRVIELWEGDTDGGTVYYQWGRRYNNEAPFNDFALSPYKSSFAAFFVDRSQNNYSAIGWAKVAGAYPEVPARLTVKDGANRLMQLIGTASSGKAELNIQALDSSSATAAGISVIGDHFLIRAGSAYPAHFSGDGMFVGGNLASDDGSGHFVNANPTARLDIRAGTSAIAQSRYRSSAAPTGAALVDGAFWNESGVFKYYYSGATKIFATLDDITTAINNLIGGAPGALDTLDELAAALADDANFAATVTAALALRAQLAASQTFTGVNKFSPSASTSAFQVTQSNGTTNAFLVDNQNRRVLIGSGSTPGSTLNVNGNFYAGNDTTAATALVHIGPSIVTRSSLRIAAGTAPTGSDLKDGDIWYDGADLHMRQGSTSHTMATRAYVDSLGWTLAPATSSSTGTAGQKAYDDNYFYVCTAANTWKRAALATW